MTSQDNSVSNSSSTANWIAYAPFLLLTLLFFAVNSQVLRGLFETWYVSYAETGHGFIAPPLAAYVAWLKKDELKALSIQGSFWGLLLGVFSVVLIVLASLAQVIFFSQLGVWLLLIALIWYLLGANWLRALQFPLLLLFLTIPPPSSLYTRLTFEMQLLASRLAASGLELLGYSVLREGNVLHMVGERLSVAEACSGIRSLVTLVFFVIVYGYFVVERPAARWILALAALPIAVLANAIRIIGTGVMAQYDRALAHGITHEVSGYITLFAGGLSCILLEQFLSRRRTA